jgi:hypothetical protein
MKKILLLSTIFIFGSVFFGHTVFADGYDWSDAYNEHAGFVNAKGIIYINGDTGEQTKVFDTSGIEIARISAIKDGLYWATVGPEAKLYKYTYSTKKVEELLEFSSISDLEVGAKIRDFQMISSKWMMYGVEYPGMRSSYVYKYYNLETKQGYGLDYNPGENWNSPSVLKKKYEMYALSSTEDFTTPQQNNVYAFDATIIGDSKIFLRTVGGSGGADTQFIEYRTLDLDTLKLKVVRKRESYVTAEGIGGVRAKEDSDYFLSLRHEGDQFHPTKNLSRYNVNTGEEVNTVFKEKSDNLWYFNGSYALLHENGKTYFYRADTDKRCEITQHITAYSTYKNLTSKYFFEQAGKGADIILTVTPIVCKNGTSAENGTPIVTPTLSPVDLTDGSLIKSTTQPAVYYLAKNGKRYVFSDREVFGSWYADFSGLKTITPEAMANITIGGNVTYRPGTRMVKISSDPRVYAVDAHGTLRWIANETVARGLYGASWAKEIRVIPDYLFINYTVGAPISTISDFSPSVVTRSATSINVDKSL